MALSTEKCADHATARAANSRLSSAVLDSILMSCRAPFDAQAFMSPPALKRGKYSAASPPTSFMGASSVVSTGQPQAWASIKGHPKPSARLGNRKASAIEYAACRTRLSKLLKKRTFPTAGTVRKARTTAGLGFGETHHSGKGASTSAA